MYFLLCLASFTEYDVCKINQGVANSSSLFTLLLQIVFLGMDICNLFIISIVDGHVCCL